MLSDARLASNDSQSCVQRCFYSGRRWLWHLIWFWHCRLGVRFLEHAFVPVQSAWDARSEQRLCCFDFVCSQFQSSQLSFVIIFFYSLLLFNFLLCFVLHALRARRAQPIFLKRHTHFLRLCLRSKMTIHNPFKVTLPQPLASWHQNACSSRSWGAQSSLASQRCRNLMDTDKMQQHLSDNFNSTLMQHEVGT